MHALAVGPFDSNGVGAWIHGSNSGEAVLFDALGFAASAVLEHIPHVGSAQHRTSKYLNNIIEADHGALKQVIRPTRGFQTMKSAIATIKGFEIMRMIRRGHCLTCERGAKNEMRFVNSLFGIAA